MVINSQKVNRLPLLLLTPRRRVCRRGVPGEKLGARGKPNTLSM